MNNFEHIKNSIDLLACITQTTQLKMKGQHLEKCPFCNGHGCFSIQADKQRYKCYQCPAGGDVFEFYGQYKNVDKAEALKIAAKFAGVTLPEMQQRDIALTTKERIFQTAANYYHSHVFGNGGKEYLLTKRGHSKDVISKMQIGWSDGGLVEHLRGKSFVDKDILMSGMGKERKTKDGIFITDFFVKGLSIFPHINNDKILHFTLKDPLKKYNYQLPFKFREQSWRFYNQNALSKHSEIIIVEGENDLLTALGAGATNIIGLIGQPSEHQIKTLKSLNDKHIYLWMDNDEGGKKFIRQICKELKSSNSNIRIITYSEDKKDPDEYLKSFSGHQKQEILRLQREAVEYTEWEILQIASLDSLDKRFSALKESGVFNFIADMVEIKKLIYIEKIEKLGFTKESIKEQLEKNLKLLNKINLYYESLNNKRDADPNYIAEIIYGFFAHRGRFFYDRFNKVYLLYRHQTLEVTNNRAFNALMKRNTKLLPTKEPGRSVWESLASEGYTSGIQIDLATWKRTDRSTDSIYLNFNSPNNTIIKISKDEITEIENGLNKDNILLKSSPDIMPFNYLPDVNIQEGFDLLKELVFDNMTCDFEQKYLIICWMISGFLLDFTPYYGLMKFSGATASGKTTAATLIQVLLFGNEHFGDPTAAASYAVASQNPLLVIDNLESDDLNKNMLKFLLLTASKKGKIKRTQGTESDTTKENPTALILVTAIEPFLKPELINRTYDIEFLKKNKSDSFVFDQTIGDLIKKRDVILSSILKVIQKDILPNLSDRKDYMTILKKEFKGHAKDRTDEYMSLLMLILNKTLKYLPMYDSNHVLYMHETGEPEIRRAWIEYQNTKARENETASNSILKLLNGLVRECIAKMKDCALEPKNGYTEDVFSYEHPEYLIELVKTKPKTELDEKGENYEVSYIEFVATSDNLTQAFDKFCKNNGIKNPYTSASVFSSRLRNDIHLLKKSGWELITKEGIEPHFAIKKGYRFWKFRKTLVR